MFLSLSGGYGTRMLRGVKDEDDLPSLRQDLMNDIKAGLIALAASDDNDDCLAAAIVGVYLEKSAEQP